MLLQTEVEEVMLPVRETIVPSDVRISKLEESQKFGSSSSEETSPKESSQIAHMMEAQQQGKCVSISLDNQTEEPKEQFRVTTHWDNHQGGYQNFNEVLDPKLLLKVAENLTLLEVGAQQVAEKLVRKRTETEKTISLQVLRQYFARSLKDAAKSIGVKKPSTTPNTFL